MGRRARAQADSASRAAPVIPGARAASPSSCSSPSRSSSNSPPNHLQRMTPTRSRSEAMPANVHDDDHAVLPSFRRSPRLAKEKAPAGNGKVDRSFTQIQLNLFSRGTCCTPGPSTSAAGAGAANDVPDLAKHERDRTKKRKPPEGPRGRAKAARISKESKVSLAMRVEQHPGQTLKASTNKQLFCEACRSVVPNISSSIASHVATDKHKQNLKKLTQLRASDCELHRDLADYFVENPDESMVSVPCHTIIRTTPHQKAHTSP